MSTTLIRNADWVIAWDAGEKRHVYRKGIDVAFGNDGITHVGPGFAGTADATVDGRGLMVMPGLVNIHSHLGHEPAYRGIREEHGVANMYMSSLYERSQAFDVSDPELRRASLEVALCEVLKSGVTTRVRHLADLRGLDRYRRQERHSRLHGAGFRHRALEARPTIIRSASTGTRRAAARVSRRRSRSSTGCRSTRPACCPA